jgi:hypothetical protein
VSLKAARVGDRLAIAVHELGEHIAMLKLDAISKRVAGVAKSPADAVSRRGRSSLFAPREDRDLRLEVSARSLDPNVHRGMLLARGL